KSAQREYLNFLSNAEREDFQELSASQNVEMEKSNIRIETARVDQANAEVAASKASQKLAKDSASNAATRLDNYRAFDATVDRISGTGMLGNLIGNGVFGALPGPLEHFGEAIIGGLDFITGGAASRAIERRIASLQRELEKRNL